ncbi:MAG: cell division protein FtsA [Deltaproteobacteria bacterium RIFOXYD12_FULL_57_12]|nr:MAG: cell division protein FtsA [Deltaproteobacteria bacterium RIFOXYD12_FULL_57_12]
MEKEQRGELIVGLDIGTTKICAVIGEAYADHINIIGVGTHPSVGIKKGMVVNIESTVDSIRRALSEAEEMAGCEVNTVCVGIAGSHIKGFTSPGIVGIKNRQITREDIGRVIDAARAVNISQNQEIIHVLPQGFMVDDHTGIQDPLGMTGVRLVTNVHIVTGNATAVHNLIMCCNRAGLQVSDIVLESLASASAVLTREEMDLGVALLDIGGGTSDLAVFSNGTIKHIFELGLGGNNLTNDLSIGLRTPLLEAERLKNQYGSALTSMIDKDQIIEVPTVGDRNPRRLSQKIMGEILEPRIEEMLFLINQEIVDSSFKDRINAGVVITGGTALLTNIVELAEQIFDMPVRIGTPQGLGEVPEIIYTPQYATGVGLVIYSSRNSTGKRFRSREKSVVGRMGSWFKSRFRGM